MLVVGDALRLGRSKITRNHLAYCLRAQVHKQLLPQTFFLLPTSLKLNVWYIARAVLSCSEE